MLGVALKLIVLLNPCKNQYCLTIMRWLLIWMILMLLGLNVIQAWRIHIEPNVVAEWYHSTLVLKTFDTHAMRHVIEQDHLNELWACIEHVRLKLSRIVCLNYQTVWPHCSFQIGWAIHRSGGNIPDLWGFLWYAIKANDVIRVLGNPKSTTHMKKTLPCSSSRRCWNLECWEPCRDVRALSFLLMRHY